MFPASDVRDFGSPCRCDEGPVLLRKAVEPRYSPWWGYWKEPDQYLGLSEKRL